VIDCPACHMLSPYAALRVNSAKHLSAPRARPFAALRVTMGKQLWGKRIRVLGPIMVINKYIGIVEKPAVADKSAVCTKY